MTFLKGKFEIQGEGRRYVALLLALGLLQIAGHYLAVAWVNGPGPLAVPQPDTLLYYQAARRIVEGHAFSFSAGTAVSSGTTTILYPFVLAIPYALGFTGEKLISAGFALNAFFYLVFLLGWSAAFRRWFSGKLALFASILLALFPQPAYCALAQSDTGFWMATSALFVAGLATNRFWLYAPLLVLGPWVRPEGMVLIIAFAAFALGRRNVRDIALSVFACASVVGVFLFNAHLTGLGGFSSVANKGYFTNHPFGVAVTYVFTDAMTMLRDVVLGQSSSAPRFVYSIPVLGVIALVIGVCSRAWERKRDWSIGVLALAALGGGATVAQSGWQGSNFDRYLAWMMPLFVAFGAAGWWWVYSKWRSFAVAKCALVLPVLFSVATMFYSFCSLGITSAEVDRVVKFVSKVDSLLPASSSVSAFGWAGIAYIMGDRRIANLSGIYSPEFHHEDSLFTVNEILKNEPKTRFDYWLLVPGDTFYKELQSVFGESVFSGPGGLEFRRADWCAFDRAAQVPACGGGKQLKDHVDVGYEKDEQRAHYKIVTKYGMLPFNPILRVEKLGDDKAVDVGQIVAGYDEMDVVNLTPGKDLSVVMRTVGEATASYVNLLSDRVNTKYAFDNELDLHLSVDGKELVCRHAHVSTNGFNDVVLTLPGNFVTASKHRLGFHGDHATFGYWFFQ